MQETTNYKLKKPQSNEFVSVDDLNYNADVLDKELKKLEENKVSTSGGDISDTVTDVAEPAETIKYPGIPANDGKTKDVLGNLLRWAKNLKADKVEQTEFDSHNHDDHYYTKTEVNKSLEKKVTASGGDISNTKVSSFAASTAAYPVPAAGESPKTLWGKVKKFCEDMNNLRASMLFIGSIVNNCATNNANLPLSAAQGKVLMDLYNVLNTKHNNLIEIKRVTDANSATELGVYRIAGSGTNIPSEWNGGILLLAIPYDSESIIQVAFFNGSLAGVSTRNNHGGKWNPWNYL